MLICGLFNDAISSWVTYNMNYKLKTILKRVIVAKSRYCLMRLRKTTKPLSQDRQYFDRRSKRV
jgi:hypothetical protein